MSVLHRESLIQLTKCIQMKDSEGGLIEATSLFLNESYSNELEVKEPLCGYI
jgi:hypothetical protein